MSTENNQLSVQPENPFMRASTALSQQLGLEPRAMIDAIKTQFFKGKEATDAQLAVVVSTARALGLNPLLPGQLYPYPDRSGAVTIMLGPDGIFTLLANNPDIVAQKDGGPAYWTEHGKDAEGKAICTGYINHRTKGLLKKTIWTEEWAVSSNPNWASRKMHMSEIRALKQAARMVVHGIPPDSDEQKLGEMYNVTNSADENQPAQKQPAAERPTPKPRATRGAAAAKEVTGEIVQEKPADPTPPAQDIQQAMKDREAKTVTNSPATAAPAPAPATAAPAPTPATTAPTPAATSAQTPRVLLAENEKITVTAKVESFEALKAKIGGVEFAAIKATLSGGYVGEVRQKEGGAKFEGAGVVALPPWQVGAVLKFELLGIKSTAPASSPSHGKIITWVQSVAAEAEEMG